MNAWRKPAISMWAVNISIAIKNTQATKHGVLNICTLGLASQSSYSASLEQARKKITVVLEQRASEMRHIDKKPHSWLEKQETNKIDVVLIEAPVVRERFAVLSK